MAVYLTIELLQSVFPLRVCAKCKQSFLFQFDQDFFGTHQLDLIVLLLILEVSRLFKSFYPLLLPACNLPRFFSAYVYGF